MLCYSYNPVWVWYLCYYTSPRWSQGQVLIAKILYECTWVITCLYPKDYTNQYFFYGRNNKQWFVVMLNCISKFPLVVFTYQHSLCTINSWLLYYPTLMMHWLCIAFIFYGYFSQVISRYHPDHRMIFRYCLTTVWYQIYQPINFLMHGFAGI